MIRRRILLLLIAAYAVAAMTAALAQIGPAGLVIPGVGFSRLAVQRSLQFVGASTQYLDRTFGAPTDATRGTISFWHLRSSSTAGGYSMFGAGDMIVAMGGTNTTGGTAGTLAFRNIANGSIDVISTQTITDTTTWHHYLVAWDTNQGTASNRLKLYIDGTEVSYGSTTYPGSAVTVSFNTAVLNTTGRNLTTNVTYTNGYLAMIVVVDGQTLAPDSFTFGSGSGTIYAKAYGGTLGNVGYFLSFCDPASTTSLGMDDGLGSQCSAAGSNDWTLTNMTTGNSSTDVPP